MNLFKYIANDPKEKLFQKHMPGLRSKNLCRLQNVVLNTALLSDAYLKKQRKEIVLNKHYENTPIQIYRKFHLLKLKIFR